MTPTPWSIVFLPLIVPLGFGLGALAAIAIQEWMTRRWPHDPGPPLDLTDELQARCHRRFCIHKQGILMPDGSVARPWETTR